MESYKKFCLNFLATIPLFGLGFLALCILLWFYDPFMFFHKPYFREQTFIEDFRISTKGIIDYVEFDSAMFGSSILENTSADEADRKIKGKWVNLAIYGSSFDERAIMLQYLLRKKQIKNIIYSLDSNEMLNDNDKDINILSREDNWQKQSRVDYLIYKDNKIFNKSFFAKLKYYLNKKIMKCAIKWSDKPECVGKKELPLFADWYVRFKNNFGGIQNWSDTQKEPCLSRLKDINLSFDSATIMEQKIKRHLQQTIFTFVDKNPQTNFYFIIPTYSRLLYKLPQIMETNKKISAQKYFNHWKYIIKWFIQESAKYTNVKVYGFDDLDYADNIANYEDLHHYNVDMNSMQLDAIANDTHILTPQNIDSYLATMESKIKNYDIAPIIEQIKAWEAQQNPQTK